MSRQHEWKAISEYEGEYTEPGAGGRTYRTRLHDVSCSACQVVRTLPSNLMPETVEECFGTSARPVVRKVDPPAEEFKDEIVDRSGSGGKVRQLRG